MDFSFDEASVHLLLHAIVSGLHECLSDLFFVLFLLLVVFLSVSTRVVLSLYLAHVNYVEGWIPLFHYRSTSTELDAMVDLIG